MNINNEAALVYNTNVDEALAYNKYIEAPLMYNIRNDLAVIARKTIDGVIFVQGGEEDDLDMYAEDYGEEAVKKKLFYNLGSGVFRHPAWTNVDIPGEWYDGTIDIAQDFEELEPLPIEHETAEVVYTAHVLEHISQEAADNVLKNSYQILKPGGVIRIVLPDVDFYWANYKTNNAEHFYMCNVNEETATLKIKGPVKDIPIEQGFLYEVVSSACSALDMDFKSPISTEEFIHASREMDYIDLLNWCVDHVDTRAHREQKMLGFHRNWWNREKVRQCLVQAGFRNSNIRDSSFGQSGQRVLRNTRYFDLGSAYQQFSLYIEAQK